MSAIQDVRVSDMSEIETFAIQYMVRGYHDYQDNWEASDGQSLPCRKGGGNPHNPYSVAFMERGVIVGHVPCAISAVCYLFLRRNGTILCDSEVTSRRRFSADLPQGGQEILYKLIFTGAARYIAKCTSSYS